MTKKRWFLLLLLSCIPLFTVFIDLTLAKSLGFLWGVLGWIAFFSLYKDRDDLINPYAEIKQRPAQPYDEMVTIPKYAGEPMQPWPPTTEQPRILEPELMPIIDTPQIKVRNPFN